MSTSASTEFGRPALNVLVRLRTSTAFTRAASFGGRFRIVARSINATSPAIVNPIAAAANTAVKTFAGSLVASRAYSMIRRPTPPARPVEISATTTPITDAVAASFNAGIMNGTAAGKRSLRSVWRHDAA